MLKRIFQKIKNITLKIRFKIIKLKNPGFLQKSNINLVGLPMIRVKVGAVILHKNVTLRSDNKSYFINMHSPVKLCTSAPNAKIIIGENSRINGTCIHAYDEIIIGKNCLIAANCQIFDTNRHDMSFHDPSQRLNNSTKTKPIHIGDDVWIGANTIILPGVTIGSGSVIAAGSVVTKNIEPFTLNGGNVCKVINKFPIPEGYFNN